MVMNEAGALWAIPGRLESRRRLNSSGGGGWLGTKGRLAAGEPARPCVGALEHSHPLACTTHWASTAPSPPPTQPNPTRP